MSKIAILIPSTSNGRPQWKSIKDTYLYKYTVKTFLLHQSSEHNYVFYIGIDDDDRILSNTTEQEIISRFSLAFKNITFKFISMSGIQKGYLTKMWNRLFKQAYDEGCDYFYQTGDDINFKTKGWINDSISKLQQHNDIGLTGPINNNSRILTQAFVSRKHMEIFGFFFNDKIMNWCCDDWYNYVYAKDGYLFPLRNHFCSNDGGTERYIINGDTTFKMMNSRMKTAKLRENTFKIAMKDREILIRYLHQMK
jgi:hypothetical protein